MSSDKENFYNVLGHNVKFKADANMQLQPQEIVDLVNQEGSKIQSSTLVKDRAELAILVALKMAADKLAIEREYKDNIAHLESSVTEAIKSIESVSAASSPAQ